MKQRFALFNQQVIRGVRADDGVVMGSSIDAFTDKLLQEFGHGAACPVKCRPQT